MAVSVRPHTLVPVGARTDAPATVVASTTSPEAVAPVLPHIPPLSLALPFLEPLPLPLSLAVPVPVTAVPGNEGATWLHTYHVIVNPAVIVLRIGIAFVVVTCRRLEMEM